MSMRTEEKLPNQCHEVAAHKGCNVLLELRKLTRADCVVNAWVWWSLVITFWGTLKTLTKAIANGSLPSSFPSWSRSNWTHSPLSYWSSLQGRLDNSSEGIEEASHRLLPYIRIVYKSRRITQWKDWTPCCPRSSSLANMWCRMVPVFLLVQKDRVLISESPPQTA